MSMAKRRTRDLRGGAPHLVIDIDPDEIECKKAQRAYRLHVVQVPILRTVGFGLLTICIFFHNSLILKSFSWPRLIGIASVMLSYSLISWLTLYVSFGKTKKIDIKFLFLVLDVFIWILMIYFSEGEKSLLFWLMVMRVADQINTSFKRVLFFGHLSVFCYLGLLLYLIHVERRPILMSHELPRILIIYGSRFIEFTPRRTGPTINRDHRPGPGVCLWGVVACG